MRKLLTMALIFVSIATQAQVNIINQSNHYEAQQVAEIIANEIYEFDTLNILIRSLSSTSTIEGAVVKNKIEPHTYVIVLNKSLSLKRLRLTMAHEFVHIKQYEHEGLEIFGDIWVWNPDGVETEQDVTWGSMTFTGYENRGFELDAAKRELIVNKKLLKILKNQLRLAKNK